MMFKCAIGRNHVRNGRPGSRLILEM
jgi:hypothetical protein